MKQYLYLDCDTINSIIAQSENGLMESIEHQEESSEGDNSADKITAVVNAGIGGGLAKLAKAEASISGNFEFSDSDFVSTTSREIVSKTLHDAAFDIAYDYINPPKAAYGAELDIDIGNYIELNRVFDFVDLNYLERLFNKDGVIDILKSNEAETIRQRMDESAQMTLNREQRRNSNNKIENLIRDAINANNKKYDTANAAIKIIKSLIPYDRMLISNDGYLIPLSERYFRIDPNDLGFKYGGAITCVGMISNVIGKDTNPDDEKNIFATIQFTANEALRQILPTNRSNLCIIHPLAVYYETSPMRQ